MSDAAQRGLSEDARAMLEALKEDETPSVEREDEVWASVSRPEAVSPRLRTPGPSAEARGRSRTWVWVATAVAAAALLALAIGTTEPETPVREREEAPAAAPYDADPTAVHGEAAERSVRQRRGAQPPSPVPPGLVEPAAAAVEVVVPPVVQRPSPSPKKRVVPDADAELAIIVRAKDALAHGRGREALRILSLHARKFEAGQLARERDVLRVEALCASGFDDKARASAAALLTADPSTPYADRLRRACSSKKN